MATSLRPRIVHMQVLPDVLFSSTAGDETTKGLDRLARRGKEAIITKKRFVPDKFLPCACSY